MPDKKGDESTNTDAMSVAPADIPDPNVFTPPCLVLVSGSTTDIGRQWTLDKPISVLGRNANAEIHLTDTSISKAHAQFKRVDGRISVTDLGATNKTMVNGQTLTPHLPYPLKNNAEIRAGKLIFRFLQSGILQESNEKARMQAELETARGVQASLLPPRLEAIYDSVEIGGRYRSATECGGDWWWHWSTWDRSFAIIGDVTGHGAGAAMITSAARSAIAVVEDDAGMKIEKVYTTLSNALNKCSDGAIVMSAFMVEFNHKKSLLRYINASHLPAVLLPHDVTDFEWSKLELLTGDMSPPLGDRDHSYKVNKKTVSPGTRLVLVTDGLAERKNESGALISEREFYTTLIQAHSETVDSQARFLDRLMFMSDAMVKLTPQEDDITVVALDFYE